MRRAVAEVPFAQRVELVAREDQDARADIVGRADSVRPRPDQPEEFYARGCDGDHIANGHDLVVDEEQHRFKHSVIFGEAHQCVAVDRAEVHLQADEVVDDQYRRRVIDGDAAGDGEVRVGADLLVVADFTWGAEDVEQVGDPVGAGRERAEGDGVVVGEIAREFDHSRVGDGNGFGFEVLFLRPDFVGRDVEDRRERGAILGETEFDHGGLGNAEIFFGEAHDDRRDVIGIGELDQVAG